MVWMRCAAIGGVGLSLLAYGCGGSSSPTSPTTSTSTTTASATTVTTPTYDVMARGIPKFVNVFYLDLSQVSADGTKLVNQISKFRSTQGHDYSDSFESCSSMKHYMSFPDSSTRIYAPVSGTVVWRDVPIGYDINIQSDAQPAFTFTIMHPVLDRAYKMGDHISEGALIGHHVGNYTSSDIVVNVNDPNAGPKVAGVGPGGRLISYFETHHRCRVLGLPCAWHQCAERSHHQQGDARREPDAVCGRGLRAVLGRSARRRGEVLAQLRERVCHLLPALLDTARIPDRHPHESWTDPRAAQRLVAHLARRRAR